MAAIGIPPQQHHRNFGDGYLLSQVGPVAESISEIAAANGVEQIVTLGSRGFDGHLDHIAAFHAARRAAKKLKLRLLVRFDISQLSEPDLILSGNRQFKIDALRHHRSQYDPDTDPATWPNFGPYNNQLESELYKLYLGE